MKLLNIICKNCSQLLFFACSFVSNSFGCQKVSNERACTILRDIEAQFRQIMNYDTLIDKTEEIAAVMYELKKLLGFYPKFEYRYRDILEYESSNFSKKVIPYMNGITGEVNFISFDDAKNMKKIAVINDGNGNSICELANINNGVTIGNKAIGQVFVDGKEAFCTALAVEHSLHCTVARWHYESHQLSILFERM